MNINTKTGSFRIVDGVKFVYEQSPMWKDRMCWNGRGVASNVYHSTDWDKETRPWQVGTTKFKTLDDAMRYGIKTMKIQYERAKLTVDKYEQALKDAS